MSFISYAQNFEDVMLWRALKDVDNGFYVDIGAQDPIVDSVSMAFYEHGWRGCHVEPTSQYSTKLRQARPDEIVLQLAIGNEKGLMSFFEFEDTGLSTNKIEIARSHQQQGFKFKDTTVPVISLDELFNKIGEKVVHWLKIDVEGAEKSVLKSWKKSLIRPWILVIESTIPLTQTESYKNWENIVINKGYEFVYFDGLNRFYVSEKYPQLKMKFATPPNVFDGFELSGTQLFNKHVAQLKLEDETKIQNVEENLSSRLTEIQARLADREKELAEQHAHKQWLQNEWDAVKAHLEQLTGELALSQARADVFDAQLAETHAILASRDAAMAEQQTYSQSLQIERDAVKARLERLVGNLALSQARIDGLEYQLAETRTTLAARDVALAEQQAHSQWLQNEWDTAKAKIDELNDSSHHWWTVADQLNRELQTIYKSKFWRITWPLRKLMQLFKWLVILPIRLVRWLIYLPRRAARRILTKVMKIVINHPGLAIRGRHWLSNYPKLKHHLRLFAQARGLIHIPTISPTISTVFFHGSSTVERNTMTPRARQIYNDLKIAIEQNRSLN